MDLEQRISSFCYLGEILRSFTEVPPGQDPGSAQVQPIPDHFSEAMKQAETENPWFTRNHILQALGYWGKMLERSTLENYLGHYRANMHDGNKPKRVGVIMAGNIPMVGFHDLLCVLLSGNHLVAKLSSQDAQLIPVLTETLKKIDPLWDERIELVSGEIKHPQAVIATGSNNTSRYFSYYFGKYPHIIRKNRTSVALLDGNETISELNGIASDIFSYFGLGCRNISKLYLPERYDLKPLHEAFLSYSEFFHHSKYRNNLDYYKSIYLVNRTRFLDGVFYLLREEELLSTPVSVIHYEYYGQLMHVSDKIEQQRSQIQCVVAREGLLSGSITEPGETQHPGLGDYADGIDTMRFLLEKI